MTIEGPKTIVEKSAKEIYNFFIDFDNFKKMMPDSTQKFEADKDTFIFGLKGMPEIRLALKEKTAFSNITLGSMPESKLVFTLSADINEISSDKSEVQFIFDGKFNSMMTMMIKKPITKFIDILTANIKDNI